MGHTTVQQTFFERKFYKMVSSYTDFYHIDILFNFFVTIVHCTPLLSFFGFLFSGFNKSTHIFVSITIPQFHPILWKIYILSVLFPDDFKLITGVFTIFAYHVSEPLGRLPLKLYEICGWSHVYLSLFCRIGSTSPCSRLIVRTFSRKSLSETAIFTIVNVYCKLFSAQFRIALLWLLSRRTRATFSHPAVKKNPPT